MSWLYSWAVNFLPIPLSDIHPFYCIVSVCNLLNISLVEGKLFCNTLIVCDLFPRIIFLLVKQKVSGGQEQEQVIVAIEFTSIFVELKLL